MAKKEPSTPKELAEFVEMCRLQRGPYTPVTPLEHETNPKVGHTIITLAHAGKKDPKTMKRRTLDGILSLDKTRAQESQPHQTERHPTPCPKCQGTGFLTELG